jgi:leucine-rich repeat-containing protein 49
LSNNNGHGGDSASSQTTTIVENGVHKVRRSAKEKDKQPDRINLDRRGLCAIPVIDNEPNLRLLSLQHNLINTFHIPDSDVTLEVSSNGTATTSTAVVATDGVKDSNNNVPAKDTNDAISIMSNGSPLLHNKMATNKPLLRQKSRNQLNLNFSANNGAINGNCNPPTSFLQKSFMFQTKPGSILKRANSVMINYSPTMASSTSANAQQQIIASSVFGMQRGKLLATPSFSSGSSLIDTNTHQESNNNNNCNNGSAVKGSPETPTLQIDANNIYMSSFRFNLTNLVFLDLYNNQIEKISNLDGLKSLTVLLLGKNRISDITGITSLKQTLRVLDLHGNRITHITQKISQLQELKSLNLAGNLLRQIQANDFAGLCCLKELNLKRNRIKKINVSDDLHNLER